jgi:hypothetical protein
VPVLSRNDTPRDQRAERTSRGGEGARQGNVAGTDHRADDDSLLLFSEDIIFLKQNHIVGVI